MWRILLLLALVGAAPAGGGGGTRPAEDTPGGGSALAFDDDIGITYGDGGDITCYWSTSGNDGYVCEFAAAFGYIAMGYDLPGSPQQDTIILGNNNSACSATNSVCIGLTVVAPVAAADSVIIGKDASCSDDHTICIGDAATIAATGTDHGIAIGEDADIFTGSRYGVAIGTDSEIQTNSDYAVALGFNAEASGGDQGVAIGQSADAGAAYGIAIGGSSDIAVGDVEAICIGRSATSVGGDYGIAIGGSSEVDGAYGVCMGYGSLALGASSVALGHLSYAEAAKQSPVAVGHNAEASGDYSIAIGPSSIVAATHEDSVAIGRLATTTAANQMMIGSAAHPLDVVGHGDITITGNVFSVAHQYAEGYIDAGSQTVGIGAAGQNAWVEIDGCASGALDGITHSACDFTIPSDGAGPYSIAVAVSFSGGGGKLYEGAISVDNVIHAGGCRWTRKLGAAGDVGSASAFCVVVLAAAEVVKPEMRGTDVTTADATVTDISMTLFHLR